MVAKKPETEAQRLNYVRRLYLPRNETMKDEILQNLNLTSLDIYSVGREKALKLIKAVMKYERKHGAAKHASYHATRFAMFWNRATKTADDKRIQKLFAEGINVFTSLERAQEFAKNCDMKNVVVELNRFYQYVRNTDVVGWFNVCDFGCCLVHAVDAYKRDLNKSTEKALVILSSEVNLKKSALYEYMSIGKLVDVFPRLYYIASSKSEFKEYKVKIESQLRSHTEARYFSSLPQGLTQVKIGSPPKEVPNESGLLKESMREDRLKLIQEFNEASNRHYKEEVQQFRKVGERLKKPKKTVLGGGVSKKIAANPDGTAKMKFPPKEEEVSTSPTASIVSDASSVTKLERDLKGGMALDEQIGEESRTRSKRVPV